MERDIPEFTKYTIVLFALNESCTRPKPAYGRQGPAGSWGQNTDQVGTFWGVLTVSLCASGTQLGYNPTWNHEKT